MCFTSNSLKDSEDSVSSQRRSTRVKTLVDVCKQHKTPGGITRLRHGTMYTQDYCKSYCWGSNSGLTRHPHGHDCAFCTPAAHPFTFVVTHFLRSDFHLWCVLLITALCSSPNLCSNYTFFTKCLRFYNHRCRG